MKKFFLFAMAISTFCAGNLGAFLSGDTFAFFLRNFGALLPGDGIALRYSYFETFLGGCRCAFSSGDRNALGSWDSPARLSFNCSWDRLALIGWYINAYFCRNLTALLSCYCVAALLRNGLALLCRDRLAFLLRGNDWNFNALLCWNRVTLLGMDGFTLLLGDILAAGLMVGVVSRADLFLHGSALFFWHIGTDDITDGNALGFVGHINPGSANLIGCLGALEV